MSPRPRESYCFPMAGLSKSFESGEFNHVCSHCGSALNPQVNQQPIPEQLLKDEEIKKKRNCIGEKSLSCNSKNSNSYSDRDNEPENSSYYCMKDLNIQSLTMEKLEVCGWYYSDTSSHEAKKILHKKSIGSFIVRDSSDPNYLYAISVKTSRGTTSVRILYHKGKFQLDCDEKLRQKMPKFDCVVRLVDFYVRVGRYKKNSCRWLESSGRKDLPVVLKKPQIHSVPDLKHMCRMAIVNSLPMTLSTTQTKTYVDTLPLPTSLKDYVKWYPYLH